VLARYGDLTGARAYLGELGRVDITLATRLGRELARFVVQP
jgi:hypothetical protein